MVEIESEGWRGNLLFRDYWIKNPEAAREYARLRQELAKQFATEREAYQAGKDGFIKAVLHKASEGDRNGAYRRANCPWPEGSRSWPQAECLLAHTRFGYSLDWLEYWWPMGLVLMGGYLVTMSLLARKPAIG